MLDLRGKVAVVTGGASGIGFGLASRFAEEGMKVVVADVQKEALHAAASALAAVGAECLMVHADVSCLPEVRALANDVLDRFGAVHVLCNNAGVATGGLSWEHSMKDWDWVLRVNLWGVIHGIHTFVPIMIRQHEEAHIVNTASVAGLVSNPYLAIYGASQHAIVALSESLGMELAGIQPKIRVSVLCPGLVATRLADAERNRPSAYALGSSEQVPAGQKLVAEGLREKLAEGMSPDEVAEHVVRALRENRFWVLTHPEVCRQLERRVQAMVAGDAPELEL